MIYGLMGAAGTGKTTLAKLVAEGLDISFQPSSISASARKHGFDAVGLLTLAERMKLQRHLFEDYQEMIATAPRPMITDRTPIDMIAYLMAEFHMLSHHMVTPELLAEADRYVSECMAFTRSSFDYVFHLGKLHVYEVKETRPALNPAYERHTDLIMKGCLVDLRDNLHYAVVAGQNLDFREGLVTETIVRRLDAHEKLRKSNRLVH
jgi:predicted ATPase